MFCKIIGFPLTKPRSVKIWKSYFNKKNLKISMDAQEIKPNKFRYEFKKLIKNENFLASAITMPYKKKFLIK